MLRYAVSLMATRFFKYYFLRCCWIKYRLRPESLKKSPTSHKPVLEPESSVVIVSSATIIALSSSGSDLIFPVQTTDTNIKTDLMLVLI